MGRLAKLKNSTGGGRLVKTCSLNVEYNCKNMQSRIVRERRLGKRARIVYAKGEMEVWTKTSSFRAVNNGICR
jgi:hypothetical protein